jgi:outer membrane lipoprotein-sorting protein
MTWAFTLAAVAVFAANDAPPAATDSSVDAFFADFTKKRDAIHSLEARFAQKNISTEETVDSGGSIVYVKPQHIVLRYERPDAGTTYLIHGRRAYEYEPDIKQLQIYKLEENPQTQIFFLGFDDNAQALREGYDVSVFETNDKPIGSRGIALRPKNADLSHFREVKLYLRDSDYLPYRIHIQNDDESEVETSITDFAINGELDPDKTLIKLPEGTKIIDNDEVVETVGQNGKIVPEQFVKSRQTVENVVIVEPLAEPKPAEGAVH